MITPSKDTSISRIQAPPPPTSRNPPETQGNSNGHVFNVPTEILCVIFIFARDLSLLFDPKRFKSPPCEITISHVCKSWRTIALDLPQLWSAYRYTPSRSRDVEVIGRFSAYLNRSGTQTLDIWLNFRGDHSAKWITVQRTLFQASLQQAARWRRYTILLDNTSGPETFVQCHESLKNIHAPNLEHFAFCPQGLHPPASVSRSKEALFNSRILTRGAPALRSTRLDSNSFYYYLPPISGLTALRIDSPSQYVSNTTISLGAFIPVLEIPSLRNLSISGINIREDLSDGIPQALAMKSLKELRCSSADVIELFQYIHTPRLETLVLKRADFPILLPKSVSALTSLVLINCSVPWKRLSQEMTHISERVTHLTISEQSSGTFHRDALRCFDPTENRWPRLVYLGCNIQMVSQLVFYCQFAELRHPFPLTLRVHRNLLELWETRSPDRLIQLQDKCELRGWDELDPLVPHYWPYEEDGADFGYDRTDYDPFGVISYN